MTGLYVAREFAGRSRRFASGSVVTAAEIEADGRDPQALFDAGVLELASPTADPVPDQDPPAADTAPKPRKTRS